MALGSKHYMLESLSIRTQKAPFASLRFTLSFCGTFLGDHQFTTVCDMRVSPREGERRVRKGKWSPSDRGTPSVIGFLHGVPLHIRVQAPTVPPLPCSGFGETRHAEAFHRFSNLVP